MMNHVNCKTILNIFIITVLLFTTACVPGSYDQFKLEDGTKVAISSYDIELIEVGIEERVLKYTYHEKSYIIPFTIITNEEADELMLDHLYLDGNKNHGEKIAVDTSKGTSIIYYLQAFNAKTKSGEKIEEAEPRYWIYFTVTENQEILFDGTDDFQLKKRASTDSSESEWIDSVFDYVTAYEIVKE